MSDDYEPDQDLTQLRKFADKLSETPCLYINVVPMLWLFRKRFHVIVYNNSMFVMEFKGGYWQCRDLLLAMQVSVEAGMKVNESQSRKS